MDGRRRSVGLLAATAVAAAVAMGPGRPGASSGSGRPLIRPAVGAATTSQAPAAASGPPCAAPAVKGPLLPWPVVLGTSCGHFEVRRGGAVVRVRIRAAPPPPGAMYDDSGTSAVRRHGHVVIYRGRQPVWRSTGTHRILGSSPGLQSWAVGARSVAFRFARGPLYVGSIGGGPEHMVPVRDDPVTWTPNGDLLTTRRRGGVSALLLRGPDGSGLATVATHVRQFVVDGPRGSVSFVIDDGTLARTSGWVTRVLNDTHALGFTVSPTLAVLPGGYLWLAGADRLAILRPSGALFGAASFPHPKGRRIQIEPTWARLPTGVAGAPAFAFTVGEWPRAGSQGAFGRVSVYRLFEGATAATLLYRHWAAEQCVNWSNLAVHGHWLLLTSDNVRVVAIDARGRASPIDLTRVLGALPSAPSDGESSSAARWAAG